MTSDEPENVQSRCEAQSHRQPCGRRCELRERYIKYLSDQPGVHAVTVSFSDLEGRFHTFSTMTRSFSQVIRKPDLSTGRRCAASR